MKTNAIKTINAHQQQIYDRFEKETTAQLLEGYGDVIAKIKSRNLSKIIDLGCGGGYFASILRSYFPDKSCELVGVDTARYDTWAKNVGNVTFVQDSAENLSTLFAEESADLVFANRVFHHFVRSSWRKSFNGMASIMKQIALVLKKDGYLCITDFFYNGWPHHTLTSRIIYALTSIRFAPVVALLRKLDAKTAGVGVCFLSKKMWLKLFSQAGLSIEILREGATSPPLPWYQRLCFFNKSRTWDSVIILRKRKA
jgi:SAM-dependent methyltransferase